MVFPVVLACLDNVHHMPALPVLERTMNREDLKLTDFCIPVNPYFPTDDILDSLKSRLKGILTYYPSDNRNLSKILADWLRLDEENLVVANGSTELITWINERLIKKSLATDVPTFGRWTDNPRELGRRVHWFVREESRGFQIDVDELADWVQQRKANALAICNPNNPTGSALTRAQLLRLLDRLQNLDVIVIDESFVDFAGESAPSLIQDVDRFPNLIVIKSFGKCLGLHGLRCGYAAASRKLAADLRNMLPPWNVNSLAEEFLRLSAKHADGYEQSRLKVIRDTQTFVTRLSRLEALTVYPTAANFVYCQLDADFDGIVVRNRLLRKHGFFVRECGSKIGSSSQHFRLATRPRNQQEQLIKALGEITAARATC